MLTKPTMFCRAIYDVDPRNQQGFRPKWTPKSSFMGETDGRKYLNFQKLEVRNRPKSGSQEVDFKGFPILRHSGLSWEPQKFYGFGTSCSSFKKHIWVSTIFSRPFALFRMFTCPTWELTQTLGKLRVYVFLFLVLVCYFETCVCWSPLGLP